MPVQFQCGARTGDLSQKPLTGGMVPPIHTDNMKTGKLLSIKVLVLAALLALANQSHALYTNYLDVAVGTLTYFSNSLATATNATRAEKKQLAEVKRALKDLGKPSASVAGDYNLFFASVAHLGDLAADPTFDAIGTNAFNAFVGEAQAEYGATYVRVASLNDFVRTKRSASNQLAKAYSALVTLSTTTNKQLGLLLGRQIYTKLTTANRLAAIGEAHPGFAADSVSGKTLVYHVGTRMGMEQFTDATHTDSTDLDGSMSSGNTYTYTRTGLSTAMLVLDYGSGHTTSVKARFTSATGGTFTFHSVSPDGSRRGPGTFDLN